MSHVFLVFLFLTLRKYLFAEKETRKYNSSVGKYLVKINNRATRASSVDLALVAYFFTMNKYFPIGWSYVTKSNI